MSQIAHIYTHTHARTHAARIRVVHNPPDVLLMSIVFYFLQDHWYPLILFYYFFSFCHLDAIRKWFKKNAVQIHEKIVFRQIHQLCFVFFVLVLFYFVLCFILACVCKKTRSSKVWNGRLAFVTLCFLRRERENTRRCHKLGPLLYCVTSWRAPTVLRL